MSDSDSKLARTVSRESELKCESCETVSAVQRQCERELFAEKMDCVCSGRGKNVAVAEESDTGLRDRD